MVGAAIAAVARTEVKMTAAFILNEVVVCGWMLVLGVAVGC